MEDISIVREKLKIMGIIAAINEEECCIAILSSIDEDGISWLKNKFRGYEIYVVD